MTERARRFKSLFHPKIVIPILLAAALLAFAFSVSDATEVLERIHALSPSVITKGFGLAAVYLTVKGLQFRMLLNALGVRVGWRQLILAFAIGEMTIPIPAGVYAQNYVLRHVHGDRFALTAAATTSALAIEAMLVLAVLSIWSVPGWWWLRPAVVAVFGVGVAAGVMLNRFPGLDRGIGRWLERLRLRAIRRPLLDLIGGLRALSSGVLLKAILAAVAYLAALAAAFFVVARGVGLSQFTLTQAVTVYAFSLAVVLMLGNFVTQLGTLEVLGVSAAQAWGYSASEGLAALVGFRLIWVLSVWLICGPTAWLLRGEFTVSVNNEREESAH